MSLRLRESENLTHFFFLNLIKTYVSKDANDDVNVDAIDDDDDVVARGFFHVGLFHFRFVFDRFALYRDLPLSPEKIRGELRFVI